MTLHINKEKIPSYVRLASIVIVCAVYVILFHFVKAGPEETKYQLSDFDSTMFKLVDVMEYAPPPPVQEKVIVMTQQSKSAEQIVETEENIQEIPDTTMAEMNDADFLPQHKISSIPVIPTDKILSRIVYPSMALQEGIEGVVYLELYIDQNGTIRKTVVLKDPGHGFADAALKAIEGLGCIPATANGQNVAVRFRYPVRFAIKK